MCLKHSLHILALFFTILRNSIFLLEWTTRMPFLPSILSIFNDAHSIAPSRHVYTLSLLRTLQFLFVISDVLAWSHIGQRNCVMSVSLDVVFTVASKVKVLQDILMVPKWQGFCNYAKMLSQRKPTKAFESHSDF